MKKSVLLQLSILVIFVLTISLIVKCGAKKQKGKNYKGELVEIFIDKDNRYQQTYKIKTSDGYIQQSVRSYLQSLNYIEIEDSIIKKEGESFITVEEKRSNYNISAVFPYED